MPPRSRALLVARPRRCGHRKLHSARPVLPRVLHRIDPGIDVDEGLGLARAVGWQYTRASFARSLLVADGQWTARGDDGAAVGMVTCVTWDALAWIGSMVVPPTLQRRGLGRALLRTAIVYAEGCGVRTLGLDATPPGRALYESEGFRPEWGESAIWARAPSGEREARGGRGEGAGTDEGTASSPSSSPQAVPPPSSLAPASLHAVYPVSPAEIMELLAYDKPRFGAGRGRYLGALMAEEPHRSFVAISRKTGTFEGHGFANDRTIGPIFADAPEAAAQLLRALETADAPPRAIVPAWNPHAERVFAAAGYARGRACTRMVRGAPLGGRPETMYAIGAWALG